jgi:hypothetical protein
MYTTILSLIKGKLLHYSSLFRASGKLMLKTRALPSETAQNSLLSAEVGLTNDSTREWSAAFRPFRQGGAIPAAAERLD